MTNASTPAGEVPWTVATEPGTCSRGRHHLEPGIDEIRPDGADGWECIDCVGAAEDDGLPDHNGRDWGLRT